MKILIVDNVRSLHNIGSFFRTCECLGIGVIYLCGGTGCPPRKEITKTALGAEEIVAWKYFETTQEAVQKARSLGCEILALELTENSFDIIEYDGSRDWALVVGHEILGVDPAILQISDAILQIPMQGKKQSLNVSVAAGIGLFFLMTKNVDK